MNLISIAKEMEKSAIMFYDDLANSSKTKEFEGVFADLAREEQKHFEIFDTWQKNEPLPDLKNIVPQVTDIQKVFEGLGDKFYISSGEFFSRSQVFGMAKELERKSITHYRQIIESTDTEITIHRALVERIIAQEENHIQIINALAEFLRHPGEWLENDEFNHVDEY